jgi:hypothetical protein
MQAKCQAFGWLALDISQEMLAQHIQKLTDPIMEGRPVDSVGIDLAANYIAAQMRRQAFLRVV